MADLLAVALKGIGPPIVAVLLLALPFGRRWLGLATALGFVAAYWLLKDPLPLPHVLFAGSNDATQWLCWCVLAAGVVSALEPGSGRPRGLHLLLRLGVLAATIWLPLINLRRSWSPGENLLHAAIAALLLLASVVTFRRLPAVRAPWLVAGAFVACLSVDAFVLVWSASIGLYGQLAGALAAALGAGLGITLWRRPFALPSGSTLPLAVGHAGLMLLGYHLGSASSPWALLAAALAPFGLWLGELPVLQRRPLLATALGLAAAFALLGFAVGFAVATAPEPSGY